MRQDLRNNTNGAEDTFFNFAVAPKGDTSFKLTHIYFEARTYYKENPTMSVKSKLSLTLIIGLVLLVTAVTTNAANRFLLGSFLENFAQDLAASPYFTWWSNNSLARVTANVADANANDGKVVDLMLPASSPANPPQGPNLQSKDLVSFGTFEARLKTGHCSTTREGVVSAFFTYFDDGSDADGDGIPDDSEIDFEWLCAEPESIYMTAWTDYDDATANQRRIIRKVNLATGTIQYTRFCWAFGPSNCDPLTSTAENSPSTVPALPSYDSSTAYYEYGFTWTSSSITWWIVNPANGQPIILWDYRGPQDRITQRPTYYYANLWHSAGWTPEDTPGAKQPPKTAIHHYIDWMKYTAGGSPPPTSTPTAGPSSTPGPSPTPNANLALGKPATASSFQSGFDPSKGVDGSTSTSWKSNATDLEWYRVDLGTTRTVNRVLLNWGTGNYGKVYQVQVSPDATNWTTIYSTTLGDGHVDDLTGLSGSGRYIRMYGTDRGANNNSAYQLLEFEVYGF